MESARGAGMATGGNAPKPKNLYEPQTLDCKATANRNLLIWIAGAAPVYGFP